MKLYNKVKYRIGNFFKTEPEAPSYEFKREQIKINKLKYRINVLIETGTFLGDTVEFFKTIFNRVYSIELAADLAQKAKLRFENDNNVTIIQGDSSDVLKKLVEEIEEPVLFWLDGHYSSEFYIGNEYIKTGRGKKETPIEEELKLIFKSSQNHVILIDDARLFLGVDDYPSISKIKKIVKSYKRNYSIKVDNDIIYILPTSLN